MQEHDITPQAAPDDAPAGRRKSRRNTRAVTHGITSANPVIPGVEDPRDWEAHLAAVVEGLQPETNLERKLAARVALALWQLERLDRYVTAVTGDYIHNPGRNAAAEDVAANVQNVISGVGGQLAPERFGDLAEPDPEPGPVQDPEQRVIPEKTDLKKIIRYEAHLNRLVDRNLRALEALQAKRLGRPVSLHRYL